MNRHLTKIRKINVKHWLSTLFLKKSDIVFYTVFIVLSIPLYLLYSHNLMVFAQNVKEFSVNEFMSNGVSTIHPSNLLTEKFTCSNSAGILLCDVYTWLVYLTIVATEVFIVWKLVKFRKKLHKLSLLFYSLLMQIFPVFSILILVFASYRVYGKLAIKANEDIERAVQALSNTQELSKNGILNSAGEIAKRIKSSPLTGFSIEESYPQISAVLHFLKNPTNEKTTLYYASILPYQLAVESDQNQLSTDMLLFPDNALVINKFTMDDLETVASALADKMLKANYGDYFDYDKPPNTHFLNEIEYVVHQTRYTGTTN